MFHDPDQLLSYDEMAESPAESDAPELARDISGLWLPPLGNTGGTLRDVSGRGNHGICSGVAWSPTTLGYANAYNGSTSYTDCGPNASLNITGSGITLAGWIRQTGADAYKQIIGRAAGTLATQRQYGMYVCGGSGAEGPANAIGFNLRAGDATYDYSYGTITKDVWHHVACTYDGANLRWWIDGVLQNTVAKTGAIASQAASTRIGQFPTGGYSTFNGLIGPTQIYSRALAKAEIQQLYADPLAIVRPRRRVYASASTTPPANADAICLAAGTLYFAATALASGPANAAAQPTAKTTTNTDAVVTGAANAVANPAQSDALSSVATTTATANATGQPPASLATLTTDSPTASANAATQPATQLASTTQSIVTATANAAGVSSHATADSAVAIASGAASVAGDAAGLASYASAFLPVAEATGGAGAVGSPAIAIGNTPATQLTADANTVALPAGSLVWSSVAIAGAGADAVAISAPAGATGFAPPSIATGGAGAAGEAAGSIAVASQPVLSADAYIESLAAEYAWFGPQAVAVFLIPGALRATTSVRPALRGSTKTRVALRAKTRVRTALIGSTRIRA